ncbi:TPA: hypothetical protein RQK39_000733 [Vibrio vulnificus]|uniref:Uncharacterized protein n=2 Tax=Vibrio vulnificus TaxID=672 RepID=A0A3Q0KYL7_VIBVU|nr:hypothetical protein [Vibrio vulnificus]AAO07608.1 hypothetical protein VV2_0666 [Vibrio vulnificus CMCP6]ANN29165.1 hypothetical protein FORC17_4102 [Vibrio vulnificus]AXX62425.1 hypothetical protein FORC53_4086 [Vibrio vulnificus]QBH29559.1 Hypothetical protein FORC77_3836 [Vibrio vulnificus]QBN17165.1 hypothetical protein E2I22_24115 [Vibrio vulnificus]
MAQRHSTPTLSKSKVSDQRFAAGHESSPKNDISCHFLQQLPAYLDPSKVVSVVVRGEHFGSWDTPREQWEAGFQVMAIESNGNEKHVKNFLSSQLSISAIKQECGAIAKALSATLIDTTINFNVEA